MSLKGFVFKFFDIFDILSEILTTFDFENEELLYTSSEDFELKMPSQENDLCMPASTK